MPEPLTARDLARVSSVGGFFALRTESRPAGAPLAQVYAGQHDALGFRVAKVRSAIGADEVRIAVSIAQLGLAARIWSVALGAAALLGRVPELDPATLYWDPDASSPDDLALTTAGTRPVEDLAEVVLERHLVPLGAALHARFRISDRLLWGNAGSALAAADREIRRWARRTGDAEAAERAGALAARLFEDPRLRGTGAYEGESFRRRSCCLYYRIPGGGVCGDCCFRTPPDPSAPRRTG
ncbi:(2Fe-2S)-binding protein [Streptomyces indicus]|nr:(2Fe-2S)-binding protein [Streptomyces indicus]